MANSINATSTGNGGIITTGDDSGVLNIQTNETTAISIDASQNATFTNGANLPNTFGFKNRLINGNMSIWQRGTTGAASGTAYVADRWNTYLSGGTGAFTSARATDAPAGSGFIYSNLCTVTTAGTPGESGLVQYIEGYNFADANWGTSSAKSVTVSFWVKSSLTGTFPFILRTTNGTWSYISPYTISAANTWERKTITIPGNTSQVPDFTNSYALIVEWGFGGSSGTTSTTNTWLNSNSYNLTGSTSLIATLGATFSLTGCQLEVGTVATSFDFRSIGTELALCQRYYEVAYSSSTGIGAIGQALGATQAIFFVKFQVTKRSSPTFTSSGPWIALTSNGGGAGGTLGLVSASTDSARLDITSASGLVSGNATGLFANGGTGYMNFSAELS